jgi:hypothetical protein
VEPQLEDVSDIDLTGIDWVICGGESGPQSREFRIEWTRGLRDRCQVAGVAFFMKQLGSAATEDASPFPMYHLKQNGKRDTHGKNPENFPADLQIEQFPTMKPKPQAVVIATPVKDDGIEAKLALVRRQIAMAAFGGSAEAVIAQIPRALVGPLSVVQLVQIADAMPYTSRIWRVRLGGSKKLSKKVLFMIRVWVDCGR